MEGFRECVLGRGYSPSTALKKEGVRRHATQRVELGIYGWGSPDSEVTSRRFSDCCCQRRLQEALRFKSEETSNRSSVLQRNMEHISVFFFGVQSHCFDQGVSILMLGGMYL